MKADKIPMSIIRLSSLAFYNFILIIVIGISFRTPWLTNIISLGVPIFTYVYLYINRKKYAKWYSENKDTPDGNISFMCFALASGFNLFVVISMMPHWFNLIFITLGLLSMIPMMSLIHKSSVKNDKWMKIKQGIPTGEYTMKDLEDFEELEQNKKTSELRDLKIQEVMSPNFFRRIKIKLKEFYKRFI
jgi:hypothetical protein